MRRPLLPAGLSALCMCLIRSRRGSHQAQTHTGNASRRCHFSAVALPACLFSSLASLCCFVLFLPQILSPNAGYLHLSHHDRQRWGVCVCCSGVCVPDGLAAEDRRWRPSVDTAPRTPQTGFVQLDNWCVILKLISLSSVSHTSPGSFTPCSVPREGLFHPSEDHFTAITAQLWG